MSDEAKASAAPIKGAEEVKDSKSVETLQGDLQKMESQLKNLATENERLQKESAGKDRKITEFLERDKSEQRKDMSVREIQMSLQTEFSEKEREFQDKIRAMDPATMENQAKSYVSQACAELTWKEGIEIDPLVFSLMMMERPKSVEEAKDRVANINQMLAQKMRYKDNAGRVGSKPSTSGIRSTSAEEYDEKYNQMSLDERRKKAEELSPEDKLNLLVRQANQ